MLESFARATAGEAMTWTEIELHWPQLTKQAQSKWRKLTELDLAFVGGSRARLIGKLEKRYGLPIEDGEQHVDEWSNYEAKPAAVV